MRLAAAVDVARAISGHPELVETSEQMLERCERCESMINQLRSTANSIAPMNLSAAQ